MMLFALSPAPSVLSQIPQGFNYQAVLRDDPSNNPIVSQGVQIRFTIQTAGAVVVYQETHSTTTDEFGAISLVVGGGTPVGAYVFSDIDWSVPLSLKTEFEYPVSGTPDYDKLMGTTPLKSVPYALAADGFTQPVEKLDIKGTTTDDEEAIFEVKNKDGQTVLAVYNEGVRIYVNDVDDVKGPKGGFAIGGFGMTKTIPHQYMFISGDSVRFNIDNGDVDKGPKGGFAIGGFGTLKGLTQKYLMVSNDSVRIYIDNADDDKGPKGGFAIGGYGTAKGKPQDLLTVSNEKVRVYLDEAGNDKGVKGGFAIGGYGLTKGGSNFLNVTPDSTRIYVSDVTKTGSLGGFAVKPVAATNEKTDFFNITSAPSAEVIKNESRIMWYPVKSALIGGEVHVGSADSVGQNSTALGYRSIAKGDQAQAFGYRSIAYGNYSTAIGFCAESDTNSMAVGYKAVASGGDAFALGSGAQALAPKSFAFGSVGIDSLGDITGSTKATGDYAYAIGLGSVASGRGSFAIGANDTANKDFSTAIGYKTKADNWYALAMGAYSQATGRYSTSIGYRNKSSGDRSVTFGAFTEATASNALASGYKSKATASSAIAMGYQSQATASSAFAAGYQAIASQTASAAFGRLTASSGAYSLAFGYSTISSGTYSMAGGLSTRASGGYSLSFGRQSWAGGDYSVAFGYLPKASSYCGTATGYHTRVSGNFAFAGGYETTARAYSSFVVGQWNDSIAASDVDEWKSADPVFIVGNGAASTSVNNAFVVFKSGHTKVDGNFYPNDDNANSLGLSTNRWTTVYATNNVINTSDIREKSDIASLNYGLKEILQLHPVLFKWKKYPDQGYNLGLIAQEVQPVISEVVDTGSGPENLMGIKYSALIPVLIKSIQEQQEIIDLQKVKNQELENQIAEINKKLEMLQQKLN